MSGFLREPGRRFVYSRIWKKRVNAVNEKYADLTAFIKETLGEQLDEALKAGKKDEAAFSAKVMFSQALITEGSPLDDPAGFAKSVTELLVKSL